MPWSARCSNIGPSPFNDATANTIIGLADFSSPLYVVTRQDGGNKNQRLRQAITTVDYDDGTNQWTLYVGANIHIKKKSKKAIAGSAYLYGWNNYFIPTNATQMADIYFSTDQGTEPTNTCPILLPLASEPENQSDDFELNQLNLSSPPPEAGPLKLQTPDLSTSEYNKPVTKHYTFNETGNIMVASTVDKSDTISQAAQDLFQEVAVFFAALTKSLASTPRLGATKPYDPTDYTHYTIMLLSRL